jgi:uncharacterized protein
MAIALLLTYLLFSLATNCGLTVTSYRVPAPDSAVKGLRIVHLSDLHGRTFGRQGKRLLAHVGRLRPDFVVITGDLVSAHQRSWRGVVETAGALAARHAVYYIPGNHEVARADFQEIVKALRGVGVTVLLDQRVIWEGRGARVALVGMQDFENRVGLGGYEPAMKGLLSSVGKEPLKILLSHRPELKDLYARSGADVVFSGHAHGGQVVLPVLGPLYSTAEGLWPRYVSGVHRLGETTLVISRGLGGLWFIPRIGNRPEIVLVELE